MKRHYLVDEFFIPPRITDPDQWEWYPSKREKLEGEASDGTLLRGYVIPAVGAPLGTIVILHGHMSCADRMPVLVLHGAKGARIPIEQGRAVFEAIPDLRKEFLELPDAGHDNLVDFEKSWGENTHSRVFDFLRRSGLEIE